MPIKKKTTKNIPDKDDWAVIKGENFSYALVCFKNKKDYYWGQSRSWNSLYEGQKVVEFIGKVPNKEWDRLEIEFIKKYFPLKPSEPKESAGWLSPDGKFYPCKYHEHRGLAKSLSAHYYNDIDNGERKLETEGWIKVYADGLLGYDFIGHRDLSQIVTKQQKEFLFQLSIVGSEKWNKRIQLEINLWLTEK